MSRLSVSDQKIIELSRTIDAMNTDRYALRKAIRDALTELEAEDFDDNVDRLGRAIEILNGALK